MTEKDFRGVQIRVVILHRTHLICNMRCLKPSMCVRREVSPDTILEEWEGWNGVETRLNSALTATGVA